MKKYKYNGLTEEIFGVTLHQIVAIKSFNNVKKGETGGWIEKYKNLDHNGSAWVSGDARVYGDARVSGDAQVYGNAWVSGDARVYGNAQVYDNAWVSGDARVYGDAWVSGDARVYGDAWVLGDAQVYGNAWVSGDARLYGDAWDKSPLQIQGTKHFFCQYTKNTIKIGCMVLTIEEWKKEYKTIGKQNGYTDEEIEEYGRYINLL